MKRKINWKAALYLVITTTYAVLMVKHLVLREWLAAACSLGIFVIWLRNFLSELGWIRLLKTAWIRRNAIYKTANSEMYILITNPSAPPFNTRLNIRHNYAETEQLADTLGAAYQEINGMNQTFDTLSNEMGLNIDEDDE